MHDRTWVDGVLHQVRIYLECEQAEALVQDSDVPQPQPDEFEKVWKQIQDGHGK